MVSALKDRPVGLISPLLRAEQLDKRFLGAGAPAAVRALDLEVAAGEFLVIMGRSGSGKSTLLHLLAGLERPTSGRVIFADQRIDQLDETALSLLRRRTMGFVFQAVHLVPQLSVLENLLVPGLLISRDRTAVEARARELLALVELGPLADRWPAQLSGGEQQRVAVARALVNQPALLFADEPTGALDSTSAGQVLALLDAIHRRGQTIVLVTHDAAVASHGERIVFMRDGAIEGTQRHAAPGAQQPANEAAVRSWLREQGW